MKTMVEPALTVVLLGGFIWVVTFLLPRAKQAHDGFGVACSILAALVALAGWLFIGIRVVSW
jgi:hypothetical protein